jgi:hypothetical protein
MDINEIRVDDRVRWSIWDDEPEIRGIVFEVDLEMTCVIVEYTKADGQVMHVVGPPDPYKLVLRAA